MGTMKVSLVGLVLVTFRRTVRSEQREAEEREKQDVKAASAWVDMVFPVHSSDADESVDEVAGTDFFPAYAAAVMIAAPTGCLDSDCVIECDVCDFGGAKSKDAEEAEKMDLVSVLIDMKAVDALREKSKGSTHKKGPSFFYQGRHEAQFDLYGLAPTCRGSRARSELHELHRMGV